MKRKFLFIAFALVFTSVSFAQIQSFTGFGSNPGNLNAYKYVPANMPSNAPLIVVMHGCTQNATNFANETAWNTLADFHKFYVIYPEQKSANNSTSCFNYWETGDHSRGQGEAQSIKQMVDYMKAQYSIDDSRVFATGLSAGGAMTAVMLSAYPDVFAAGAEMAGLPYKVATSSLEVYTAAVGLTSKSPQAWGDLVRNEYPAFSGMYPRMVIFHGTSDLIINENNAEETMKQFTNLHGADQTPEYTNASFNGNAAVELKQYHNANGVVVVERYTFDNMGHGIAVDPGSCFEQGGGTGSNALDVNFYSSYYAAKFFGILQPPFTISGLDTVTESATGVVYSVTGNAGSDYDWLVAGGNIAGGQGTNSISVDWVDSSGTVALTEITSDGCTLGPIELSVLIDIAEIIDTVDTTDTIDTIDTVSTLLNDLLTEEALMITATNRRIEIKVKAAADKNSTLRLYHVNGQVLFEKTGTPDHTYLINDLAPGIYFAEYLADRKRLVKKIVVR